MLMIKSDLDRRFFLDVDAAGYVYIRERGAPGGFEGGVLPVFSCDTWDDANMLRVLHCRLARDGSGMYRLNNPPDEGDAVAYLGSVSEMFRKSYGVMQEKRVVDAKEALRVLDVAANIMERRRRAERVLCDDLAEAYDVAIAAASVLPEIDVDQPATDGGNDG